ncbi:unnamed protein product [Alternaria alternata]
MDAPSRVVDSGGGAVFQGDVTAGRDITINHITEIRQITERLSSRFTSTDTSEKILGSLEALSGAAEFTEEYAKELKAGVFSSDLPLERIFRECASISSELKRLESLLGRDRAGGDVFAASLNENVVDIRSRLMSLQMHFSNIHSRKTAKDFETIKEAVTQLMDSQSSSDGASSIRTFYTASAIPYVERQMWQEVQNALCARFTTEFVRDNYALIVASVEELVFEKTSSWIAHGPNPDGLASEAPEARTADTYLRLSEKFNVAISVENGADDDASIRPIFIGGIDRTGVQWSKSVEDRSDGGGVKSYSSILILEFLMDWVITFENRFEQEFTHYPRTFTASDFRPCHYFHKVYGTSTGGVLAIALSRLRMTVAETISAFESILNAMYGGSQKVAPLATKYNHSDLEATLLSMAQRYCKQHERGTCNHEHKFRWPLTGIVIDRDDDEIVDRKESNVSGIPNNGNNYMKGKQQVDYHSETHSPDHHVCQAICITAVNTGGVDEAYMLRTYNHIYDLDNLPPWVRPYNEDSPDLTISQVGRATTAIPPFFKALKVNGPLGYMAFKDGGIRENNPSYCAYSEAASLCGNESNPSLLLSIGAGLTDSALNGSSLSGVIPFGLSTLGKFADRRAVFKNVLIIHAEAEIRHKTMRTIADGTYTWYKRFEVTQGLEKIVMNQWESGHRLLFHGPGGKTLNTIRTATEAARELEAMTQGGKKREQWEIFMGKHLPGEREFFHKYQAEWDFALLGRKQ